MRCTGGFICSLEHQIFSLGEVLAGKLDGAIRYEYINKYFCLDYNANRLVQNITDYVNNFGLVDQKDVHNDLYQLLDGAIGLKETNILDK